MYWAFLNAAWVGVWPLLADRSTIVIRLGGRTMDDDNVTAGLLTSLVVPGYRATIEAGPDRSDIRRRQTSSFRPGTAGLKHELDYTIDVARLTRRPSDRSQDNPGPHQSGPKSPAVTRR
jgi:hypothetical protein